MTPQPSYMQIVEVSMPGLSCSLGYVQVDGFWQSLRRQPSPGWKQPLAPRTTWKASAPPTAWKET
ncbi:MAG TPA: hypothetical protein VKB77_08325 [Terriglobales bacterium]|nr:hypothetical protein [Terriglobales bacterium]